MRIATNNYVRSTGWGLKLLPASDELFEPVEQVVARQRAEHEEYLAEGKLIRATDGTVRPARLLAQEKLAGLA